MTRSREITGPAGRLEALLEEPPAQGGVNAEGLLERGREGGLRAAVGIAPPISRFDFEKARTSDKPKFFIQGERDELCPLKDMQEFYAKAHDPKELAVIDAADHLFDGKVLEVGDAIEDLFGDWNA